MSRLPSVPLDTVRDQMCAAGRAGWLASWANHRGAASAAATADQGLVACGLASFRGRQRALGLPALWADQIPRFPDGIELRSRLPVLPRTEVMPQHLLTAEGPQGHGGWPG